MKTNQEIAKEVLAGQWGNGQDRRDRLTAAGYNYDDVQSIVNSIVYSGEYIHDESAEEEAAAAFVASDASDHGKNYLDVDIDLSIYDGLRLHFSEGGDSV